MIEPISPDSVVGKKQQQIPDHVIEAFNQMIAKRWDGSTSRFTLDEVVDRIMILEAPEDPTAFRSGLFKRHELDVEPVYRAKGWNVEFDKPAYCEDYAANFKFARRK